MSREDCILGIDTSNYKTSVCVLNHDNILCDLRRFLDVAQGERGLRQSDALFQHLKNLPELMEEVEEIFDGRISAVACSSKPRPVEGSYMPVFLAGEGFARAIGSALRVPVFSFSHQEGHIQAIKSYTEMSEINEFLACHFSGGTCEVLRVRTVEEEPRLIADRICGDEQDAPLKKAGYSMISAEGAFYEIGIVGGSKDISFGQVLDRAGVAMGFPFPAGDKLDEIACSRGKTSAMLTPIRVVDGQINLSGIDTQIKNKLKNLSLSGSVFNADNQIRDELIREIFTKLSDGITEMLRQVCRRTGLRDVIMSGGVLSSRFIREHICDPLEKEDIIVYFDENENGLATDNAVGTALLGGKLIWDDLR